MKNISASIVIYNEKEESLRKVVESFLSISYKKELIVVDNSPNDLMKFFCDQYKEVTYVFLNKNVGFGKGHNIAFQHLKEKSNLHLILNPDIFFDCNEIMSFLAWLLSSPNISLAIPKVLFPDGKIQNVVRNIPTVSSLIKRKFKKNHDVIDIEDNSVVEIPFAHGCFMAFKTEVFEKINGFDERFFMYMEDVDIWMRAKKYGKTVINTNYKMYHEYRKGSSKSFKLLWLHLLSAYKFFMKIKV